MLNRLYLVLAPVCLYIIYKIHYSLRIRRLARQLNCEPVHHGGHQWPLGIDQVLRVYKASRAHRLPDEYLEMFEEEGRHTFETTMLGTLIQTSEPENVKAILATQFKDFELGELRRNQFKPFLGEGIFTNDGAAWEHSRAMLRPQFARDQVSDLCLEENHVQTLMKLLPAGKDGWTAEKDILPMFFRLTIDSATEFLFGESVASQDAALRGDLASPDFRWSNLAQAFDQGTQHLGDRTIFANLYWLHNPASFKENIKEVNAFADYCVQKALQRRSKPDEKQQRYVFLDELASVTQDPIELRSETISILLAGRDTTASLLSWTFWLLARHPHVYHKLRQTILQQFSDPSNITFASLKSCTYLQYVMNEVLRLYPPVPLNSRKATRDTTLPLGGGPSGKSKIFIPKGTEVGYYIHIMHRRKDLWGEDAGEFRPERWEGRRPGWSFLPFNGGPRICLGQQFALTEAGYVIVRLLQRFDGIETSDGNRVPKHKYGVTDAPVDCWVRFHEAE